MKKIVIKSTLHYISHSPKQATARGVRVKTLFFFFAIMISSEVSHYPPTREHDARLDLSLSVLGEGLRGESRDQHGGPVLFLPTKPFLYVFRSIIRRPLGLFESGAHLASGIGHGSALMTSES